MKMISDSLPQLRFDIGEAARIFIRIAGIRHSVPSQSISPHSAYLSSPGRTKVLEASFRAWPVV